MAIFKLKTNDPSKFGHKNVLLHAGEVQFDENGIAELELENEDQFNELINGVVDFVPVIEDEQTKVVGNKPVTEDPLTDLSPKSETTSEVKTEDPSKNTIAPQVTETNINESGDAKNDIGGDTDNKKLEEGGDKLDEEEEKIWKNLKIDEMKDMARESGFPAEEWENKGKVELRNYLKDKLAKKD